MFDGLAVGTEALDLTVLDTVSRKSRNLQFDTMNFRSPDDRNYYETIGSNAWLKTFENFVEEGLKRLQPALSRRSKVVSGKIAMQELKRPRGYA